MTAALLLLLLPAALAASAPSPCLESDGACPGSGQSLLQSKSKLDLSDLTFILEGKESMHSSGVVSDEVVDELHARAEAMVQNGQALTPLERTTLNALNKTLGGMLPALQDGHAEDQAEIDAAVQFIKDCTKNFDEDAEAAKTAKAKVSTSQKEHMDCRGEQSKLKAEAVKASEELDKFWKPLVLPKKPAVASQSLIDDVEKWLGDHKKPLAEKLSKNAEAHGNFTKKAGECDFKQSALESGFCQWFGRATAANKSYARCWIQSGSTFAKLKAEALASAEGRKFQYVAIHKIQCYMKVIFLPSRKSLDKCKNLSLDTSGFNLTNTVAEPQKDVAGELGPMDSKPGDESWKQSVYAGLSGVANVTPCAVAHYCGSDEKVLAHRCVACEPGKTNHAGDDALGPNTSCIAILCSSNEYVSSNACKSCAAGTQNAAADDASGADTSCTAILCQAGQRVQNNSCHSCPAGSKNEAGGHDASGADTTCDPIKCGMDHYVQSNACHTCPAGKTRPAGDDATKKNTSCSATLCKANQKVVSNRCKGCPPGRSNVAGDDASGANSVCDSTICTTNQHVAGNACIACPDGTSRPAGDDASGNDTACSPILQKCHALVFPNANAAMGEYELEITLPSFSQAGTYTLSALAKATSDYKGEEQLLHSRWWSSGGAVIGVTVGGFPSRRDTWEHISVPFSTGSSVPHRLSFYVGYPLKISAGDVRITDIQITAPDGTALLSDGSFPFGKNMASWSSSKSYGSYSVQSDMCPKPKSKWTRIFHCEGKASKNRLDFSKASIKQMAEKATQVKICTKGDPSDCVVSKANSFPIKMLRQGKTASHDGDSSCNSQCVKGVWANTGKEDRLPRLWNTCGKTNPSMMFWACNNQNGMHLSINDGGSCNWFHTRSENIEIFIDSAP